MTSLSTHRSHANSILNCGGRTLNDHGNSDHQTHSVDDRKTLPQSIKSTPPSSSGSFQNPTAPASPRRSIPAPRPATPAITTSHHASSGTGNGNGRPSTPTPRQSAAAMAPSSLPFSSGAAATRSPGVTTTRQRLGLSFLHDRGSFRKLNSSHDTSSSTGNHAAAAATATGNLGRTSSGHVSSISPGLSELLQSRSRIRRQHSVDDKGRSTSAEALTELLESRSTFRRHHSHEDNDPSAHAGLTSATSAFSAASTATAGAAGKRSSFSGVTAKEREDGSNRPKLSDFKFSSLDERGSRLKSSSPTLAALEAAAKSECDDDNDKDEDNGGENNISDEATKDESKTEEELKPKSRFPFVPMDFQRINTASTEATVETNGSVNVSVENCGADETPAADPSSTAVAPEILVTNTSEEIETKTRAFDDTRQSQVEESNLDKKSTPKPPKVELEIQAKSTRLRNSQRSLRSFHQDSSRSFASVVSSLHNSLNAGTNPKSSGSVVTFCESLTSTSYFNGGMCPSSSAGSESNSDDSFKTKPPNNSSNSSETLGVSNSRNAPTIFRDDRSETSSTPLATIASSYTSFASTSSVASLFSGGEESLFQRQNSKSGRKSSFRELKSGSGLSGGDTKTSQPISNVLSDYLGMTNYFPKGNQKQPTHSNGREQPKKPPMSTHQKADSKQKNQKSYSKPMITLETSRTKDDSLINIRESISQVKKLISNVENNGTYNRGHGMTKSKSFNGWTNESFDDDDISATSQDIASLKRTLASLQEASKMLEEQKRMEEDELKRLQQEGQKKSERQGSFIANRSLCDETNNLGQSSLLKAAKDLLRTSSNDKSVASASTAVTYLTQQPKDHDAADNRAGNHSKLSMNSAAPAGFPDVALNSSCPKLLAFFDMTLKAYHEKFHTPKTKKSRMPMTMPENKVHSVNVPCTEPPPPPPPSSHPSPSKSHKVHNHTSSNLRDNGNRAINSSNEANPPRLDSSDIPQVRKPQYSQYIDTDKKRNKDVDLSSRSLSREGDRKNDQMAPPSRQCTKTIAVSSSKTSSFYESHRHHPYPKSTHTQASHSCRRGRHASEKNLTDSHRSSVIAKFPPPPPPPSRKNKADPDGYHSVTASLIHLPQPEKKLQRRESRHADMSRKTRGPSSGRSSSARRARKGTSLTSSLKKLSTIQKENLDADLTAPGEVTLIGYNDEHKSKTAEEESQSSLVVATDHHSRSRRRDDNPYVVANPYVVPLRKNKGNSFHLERTRESSRDAPMKRNEFDDMRHRNRSMSPLPQPKKVEAERRSFHGRKLSRGRPSSRQPRAPSKSRSSSRNRQENNNISPTTVVLTNLISNAIEEVTMEDKYRNRKKVRSHRKSRDRHRSSSPRIRNRSSSLPHGTNEFHDAQIAHVPRDHFPSKGPRSSKSPSRITESSSNHNNNILKRSMSSGRISHSDFDAMDAALRASSQGRSKSKNMIDSNGRSRSNGRSESNHRRGKKSNLHRGMSKSFHEDYLLRGVDISTLKSRM